MAATARKPESTGRYTDHLKLRVQPALAEAIDRAAAQQFTTPSEYIRQAMVKQLRCDGLAPSPAVVAS